MMDMRHCPNEKPGNVAYRERSSHVSEQINTSRQRQKEEHLPDTSKFVETLLAVFCLFSISTHSEELRSEAEPKVRSQIHVFFSPLWLQRRRKNNSSLFLLIRISSRNRPSAGPILLPKVQPEPEQKRMWLYSAAGRSVSLFTEKIFTSLSCVVTRSNDGR